MACFIALMCFGVVPQQPPMMLAPLLRNWTAYSDRYSGVVM